MNWDAARYVEADDANRVKVPLHRPGMLHAVALTLDAAARWGLAPDDLVFTFRDNCVHGLRTV